ncbi:ABC transporter permease [Chloroflexota bacterium]
MNNNSSVEVAERRRHTFLVSALIRLVKEKPLGMVGGVITLILLLTGILADVLAPYGMNEMNTLDSMVPPSARYWLGTDNMGRDIFSRVIFGARLSMIVGLSAAIIGTLLASLIGILSGYLSGKFDLFVQRLIDSLMCIPAMIFLIVIISFLGPGIVQVIVVLGLRNGITASRILRGATLSTKNNVYIEAARAIGCSTPRIILRHILPNIIAPAIIVFTLEVPRAILTEASLSFLGYGIPPPYPSWGGMLSGRGRDFMFRAPWMVIWPGLALSIAVYGVSIFGDALRDILDPRMRGGAGRYGKAVRKLTSPKSAHNNP